MNQLNSKRCQMEGCFGVSTGNLKITDKETMEELDVCSECWHFYNKGGEK